MRCNTSDLSPEHPKCINLKQFYSIDFALFLEMHPNKSSRRLPPTCFPLSPGKRDIAKAFFSEESVPPFFTSSAFFHGTIVFYFPVSLSLSLSCSSSRDEIYGSDSFEKGFEEGKAKGLS